MTGEKNRFKFDDEKFKDPTHDEIVINLLDIDYLNKLIPLTKATLDNISWTKYFPTADYYGCVPKEKILLKKLGYGYYTVFDTPDQLKKTFKDEDGEYKYKTLFYHLTKQSFKIETEKPIMRARSIVGYWDIVFTRFGELEINDPENININFNNWGSIPRIVKIISSVFIEVKPKIDSFGKVMRQLQHYQKYQPYCVGNIYLITPDVQKKAAFENQGIKVISP